MSFSEAEVERYARHLVLREVGGPGQQKLKAARVLMVGAGGLGEDLGLEAAALVDGIVELGEGVGVLAPGDEELEAVGERARSELQKSIDRVKADVRQKEVEIELRVDQAAREADAKLAAVKAQLATANAQTRARLAHRFACVSGSLDARGARLKQAADLVKQARL